MTRNEYCYSIGEEIFRLNEQYKGSIKFSFSEELCGQINYGIQRDGWIREAEVLLNPVLSEDSQKSWEDKLWNAIHVLYHEKHHAEFVLGFFDKKQDHCASYEAILWSNAAHNASRNYYQRNYYGLVMEIEAEYQGILGLYDYVQRNFPGLDAAKVVINHIRTCDTIANYAKVHGHTIAAVRRAFKLLAWKALHSPAFYPKSTMGANYDVQTGALLPCTERLLNRRIMKAPLRKISVHNLSQAKCDRMLVSVALIAQEREEQLYSASRLIRRHQNISGFRASVPSFKKEFGMEFPLPGML